MNITSSHQVVASAIKDFIRVKIERRGGGGGVDHAFSINQIELEKRRQPRDDAQVAESIGKA